MAASDVAAFSLPAVSSGGAAAVAKVAAAGLGLAVPGGIVLGALSERLALRSVRASPLLPLPSASQPTAQKAWGTAVRAATGAVAVRGLYLWSGMSAVDAAASAAALGGASASSNAGTTTVAKLGADALTAMLTFIIWTVCLATGAKIGSALQPVGITGGIACGKSTVSELLAAKDEDNEAKGKGSKTPFAIIDVDKIGHDILIPGKLIPSESAYDNVVKAFGTDIVSTDAPTTDTIRSDGGDQTSHRIERRKLGDVIFRDPSKRKILNKLTHPLISKIMIKRVVTWNLFRRAHDTKNKLVAVDIPLLFEVGLVMKILFGLKVVVACKPSTQLKRLMTQNTDLTEEQCQNRIDSQMPVSDKVKMADVVIWNDGDMDELKADVEKARADICARVGGWGISLSRAVLVLGASAVAKTVATASGL